MLTQTQMVRYKRNIQIDVIGLEGQEKLLSSRVLVVGAGGLGSPVCLYLAAAGVGTIGLIDNDEVELSNLQRQILHRTSSIGTPKVSSAANQIRDLNPDTDVVAIKDRLTTVNAREYIEQYDVVVGAVDNLSTRYVLNDACVEARKTLVEAGVVRFDGLLFTIVPGTGPCYRCLFPEEPPAGAVPGSDTLGILGAVAGTAGALQALEVIKVITGAGTPLVGRALLFDGLEMAFREIKIERHPDCPVCSGLSKR